MSRRPTPNLCHVLGEDPELAEAIEPDIRQRAVDECIAPVMHLHPGAWTLTEFGAMRDGIGLLVLDGLLIRRVGVDGRFGAELLGDGDLLRPWQGEDRQPVLPHTAGWRVLLPTRVAVLDARVAQRFARYPELTARLVGRALQRSRGLAVNMAIVHQSRVDVRLHMLFWHLADRWGRVGPDGVTVPLHLTHAVLADLVAARRPTVTGALSDLAKANLVIHSSQGWRLPGEPPGELLQLESPSVRGSNHGSA